MVNITLADVAISGNYNDLLNKPDISTKADKVSNATAGNFAGLDSEGNLINSGKKATDFLSSNTFIPTALSDLSSDSTHRLVTDSEKTT